MRTWTLTHCFPTFFDLLRKIASDVGRYRPPPSTHHAQTTLFFHRNDQLFRLHTKPLLLFTIRADTRIVNGEDGRWKRLRSKTGHALKDGDAQEHPIRSAHMINCTS